MLYNTASLSDFALPLIIPAVLFLIAGTLMLRNGHHSTNLKRLHAMGRFYIAFCYLAAVLDLFSLLFIDYQALFRGASALLALEEIIIWVIDHYWPVRKH